MNVTLNIEIKTHLSLSEKIEFMGVLKEQLSEHLLDAEIKTTLISPKNHSKTPGLPDDIPTKLEKNIHIKLNVPIELDECGRRKSPTCIAGKYLDGWIQSLTPNYKCNLSDARFPQKTIDLATLPIKIYNEKYKSDLPEAFMPGTSYSGIYINPQTRPKT